MTQEIEQNGTSLSTEYLRLEVRGREDGLLLVLESHSIMNQFLKFQFRHHAESIGQLFKIA